MRSFLGGIALGVTVGLKLNKFDNHYDLLLPDLKILGLGYLL